jgi:hypothetical protein
MRQMQERLHSAMRAMEQVQTALRSVVGLQ